jgi:hypothetical protein
MAFGWFIFNPWNDYAPGGGNYLQSPGRKMGWGDSIRHWGAKQLRKRAILAVEGWAAARGSRGSAFFCPRFGPAEAVRFSRTFPDTCSPRRDGRSACKDPNAIALGTRGFSDCSNNLDLLKYRLTFSKRCEVSPYSLFAIPCLKSLKCFGDWDAKRARWFSAARGASLRKKSLATATRAA